MIKDIVKEFVLDHNIIVTAPTGNGTTTLTLQIASTLADLDKRVLFYNPLGDIDREFVKSTYPNAFSNIFFFNDSLAQLLSFLDYINYNIDFLVLDPGDSLMMNKGIYPLLNIRLKNKGIIATSQIRQDPNKGGQIYSPVEELNKKNNLSIFNFSIWIRNVTEMEQLFKSRYLDIYDHARIGNEFLKRYIVRFDSKTGVLIE
jgi:hypothetical protein